jgi:Cys-tRNA(Pro)/Cys-tRNA(Cys) deacylase
MTDTDTPALARLAGTSLEYEVLRTERASSVEESASFQGIRVDQLVRTLVVRRGENDYLFVLVPGGLSIDWPKLRAHLGVSRLSLPDADEARAATGYERGAITPFGASSPWPVVVDASVAGKGIIALGGGAHGVNIHMDADDLIEFLGATVADVSK